METIRIAAAQAIEHRGEIDQSLASIIAFAREAQAAGARLLCFPEAFLQGYLTEEHAAREHALDLASPEFLSILRQFPQPSPMMVIGLIEVNGARLFNTAVVIDRGRMVGRYRKIRLLGSESAFTAGTDSPIFEIGGLRFGINICSDTGAPECARSVAEGGGQLIVCPANNMLPLSRAARFKDIHNAARGERCRETGLWMISSDVTGERPGCIGWGPTAVLDPDGMARAQLPLGIPGLLVFDLPIAA